MIQTISLQTLWPSKPTAGDPRSTSFMWRKLRHENDNGLFNPFILPYTSVQYLDNPNIVNFYVYYDNTSLSV